MDLSEILKLSSIRALATADYFNTIEIGSIKKKKKRRRVNCLKCTTPQVALLPAAIPSPQSHAQPFLDICFENPLDGCFKDTRDIKTLLSQRMAIRRSTSYCHYGFRYRKRTVFITSLTSFRPLPPCPKNPCAAVLANGIHQSTVSVETQSARNSIPEALLDELFTAWTSKYKGVADAFLVIDLFAGFGSVRHCIERRWPNVKLFCNDIVLRAGVDSTLDLSTDSEFHIKALLVLAVRKHFPAFGSDPADTGVLPWLRARKVAVLFFCSTPCETYSTNGMGVHRGGFGAPRTQEAHRADIMNASIANFFMQSLADAQVTKTPSQRTERPLD
jgi:hypothetical protein